MSIARTLPEFTDCCQRCGNHYTASNPPHDEESTICLSCYSQDCDYVYEMMRDLSVEEEYNG